MNNDFQDVEYTEVNEDEKKDEQKTIRGKRLYYSTSQVANLLEIPDSKVRYYTSAFDDILKIEVSNKQRKYTDEDINKLRFILELKDEGMTVKQIHEYCEQVDFESENGIQIKESNPLSIQALAKALMEEQTKQMQELKIEQQKQLQQFKEELKSEIIQEVVGNNEVLVEQVSLSIDALVEEKLGQTQDQIKDLQQQHQETLKDYVAITIDEKLSEKISDQSEEIKSYMDTKEQESLKKDNEMIEMFKQHMEERKKESESKDQEKNKGFWGRLFNK